MVDRGVALICAVVLAAGASSRMGRAKAVLPLGPTGETVLARVIRGLLAGGVTDVTVVAGAHIDAVRSAMPSTDRRLHLVEHQGWAQGQLSSLVAGLDAVADPQLEALLVTLVDVPLVRPDTVAAVLRAWRSSRAPITRPVDGDRHGHPVIFDASVFDELRAADPRVGAKAVFATHRTRILDVPVTDEGAFIDLDTPADYQRINRS
ncbi:MAG: nucleotidyltransferase family protein [Acidobacteriota bacterium]|nr:nucleotidyltransferase family protein [Acidobacteriota bacterium]